MHCMLRRNEPNGGTWLPHTSPPGGGYARLVLAVGAAREAAGLQDELLIGPTTSGESTLPFKLSAPFSANTCYAVLKRPHKM